MTPENARKYDRPWLLLCEGVGDQRFFCRLIEERGIKPDFSIRFPEKEGKYRGGRSCFGADLLDISVDEDFIQNVRAILIVSDKDEDANASFQEVLDQIRKVDILAIPEKERVVARKKGCKDVVVLMLPMDGDGNLEKLCLKAAYAKWPSLKQPLDAFVDQSPSKSWRESKQSKMRIQTLLAATNDSQPDTGFAGHWNQKAKYQIPVTDSCFDEIAKFLTNFSALVVA